MDLDTFWKIIDTGMKKSGGDYEVAPIVTQLLEQLSIDELFSFVQHQDDLLSDSYRHDLWAIAFILNGGCSDDGFEYFRGWLMANGRERWEATMENPESISKWVDWNEFDYEYEEMLYVGAIAYQTKTGDEFPYAKIESKRPSEPTGKQWQEDKLEELYPELSRKRSESWPTPPLSDQE